ncbi:hypothetical protein [Spirillospora sp. CA-128828]|uniref:hypothetical protein n=1 Tax=Spirillospora sp. CA-128828 TaxID=3240033 RepID=UPI003D8A4D58
MARPEPSGPIRWTTESDPKGPDSSRITPVHLGREWTEIAPNWLWLPESRKGALGHLDFGTGKAMTKARRKAKDLATGLRLSADPDTVAGESAVSELRFRDDGSVYVQAFYSEFQLGNAFEHVLIHGEPGKVLADRPETVSIVLGGCNGSNRATISTNPEGRRTAFQLGSHGADGNVQEYITSAGFVRGLSFYEQNLAYVATRFAANAMLHSPESARFPVVNDVPWRAYWLYMHDALRQSKTSAYAYDRWRDEATRRCRLGRDRNVELLREVLGDQSAKAELIDRDELVHLDQILEDMKPGRNAPELQVLVDTMRNSGDMLWNLILDPDLRTKVKYRNKFLSPELQSVQDLCGASYVVAVLRQMLVGAVMSVNDYVEQTIEHYVQEWTKVLTEHAKVTFRGTSCAVYPFAHFVPRERGEVMYRRDPGRIVTVNDPIGISGFHDGEWVDPVDLLPGSYLW